MKTKADYKAAMEYVQDACQKQERVTGSELNKKFGTSLYFLKAMIKAGYIEKKPGFKYRWRIDVGVLPIMVRRIQSDITAWNMDNVNKSKKKSTEAVMPIEPEVVKPEQAKSKSTTMHEEIKKDYEHVAFPKDVKSATSTNKTLSKEDIQNEKIARLEGNMHTIKAVIKLQSELNDGIISVLESKPEERKTSIKLFGLPIFSITRS